ncbi:heparinase II/III family protein [Pelagibacteraceae bacterium]|nr:heparinase II/III family protein [Pelagibacteraceae bacterium]
MFGIKNVYFYLIAIQITFIKFLKKIYFSSNHYNKSLESKKPLQAHFNPNPFLLSIITPYKKISFKINEVDANLFWIEDKKRSKEQLHNFFWLNLIDRKTDSKNIKKIIYIWMLKNSKYKKDIWETSTLSARVTSWILNIDIILDNATFDFKKNFINSIITQTNHLKKNIKFEKDYLKKIEIFTTLILSGLVFKEYEENYRIGIKELEDHIEDFFDNDGFPLSRNPNDLFLVAKYLIFCKEIIKDAQIYIPEFLENIIEKNLDCLDFIKCPDDQLPLFNGASENSFNHLDEFLINKTRKKNAGSVIGGLFKFKHKNHLVFFDIARPPRKNFSKCYQSGPLSFEYFLDGVKIISNSGFGNNISSKTELISRLTACQSTLTLNDTSVSKFERNKLINKVFGNSIKDSFKIYNLNFNNDENIISCSAEHSGYEKKFSCIHKREIFLDKKNNYLKGSDHIFKKKDGIPIRYVFRFHVNPKLTVVKTMGGNSALIQFSKNKSLIFTIHEESLKIEKSIFLGGKKILDSSCITISGNLVNKNKSFYWEIKKSI